MDTYKKPVALSCNQTSYLNPGKHITKLVGLILIDVCQNLRSPILKLLLDNFVFHWITMLKVLDKNSSV